eukprot:4544628-Prymnesium_polylepis.1
MRAIEAGETLDHSVTPVYLEHVEAIYEAFALAGTAEAAQRKLAVKTLWRGAGRPIEVGFYINLAGMRYDALIKAPVFEIPQTKTSKYKLLPFLAGATRHND